MSRNTFVRIASGLAALAFLAALRLLQSQPPETPRRPQTPVREGPASEPEPSAGEPAASAAPLERLEPSPAVSHSELAAAMDTTTVRHLVGRLRLAVLSGDTVGQDAAEAGLKRRAGPARAVLAEVSKRETNPRIVHVLNQLENSLR